MNGLDRGKDEFMEDVFLQDHPSWTIAEHANECSALFHKYMVMPEIVPDPTIMDDQLARFKLWASNMEVYGPPNVSLDYRLRFSPTVVEIIHQLLDIILDTLSSLKPIKDLPPKIRISSRKRQRISEHNEEIVRSDSESDVDQAEENISKITDTLGGTVTRLFRLSNAVRKSAKANRARKIERYTDDEEANKAIAELRLYTDCYIRFRFPMAPDSLRSALVEANALRLRRLYYQRSHRRRTDMRILSPEATPTGMQLAMMKESPPAVRFASSVPLKPATSNKTPGPAHPPPVPVTNATTARQTAVLYAKSTTEVPRAKSVLVNNKLSFPPVPPTKECPFCGVIIEYKDRAKLALWHNHVIGDLEPFICVFAHCLETSQHGTGPPTFETSKAWISHMQNAHGYTWECRARSHDPITFDQEIQYQEHSIKEHGVPQEHAGTLSSAARRPVVERVDECPFGDDFQPPANVESSGGGVFSSEALQSHVVAHIKEIALLTLQKLPSDGDEDAENVDSDIVLEDDGPGFATLRPSMYSVMDDDEPLTYPNDDAAAVDRTLDRGEEEISASVTILDLEDKDDSGMTQLHRAVQAGNLGLVESLIHEGANLSSRDKSGRTALHYTSMEQSRGPEIMNLLLNSGGNAIMDVGDTNGQTALHYAAERDFIEGIQILVDHGADTATTDNYGFSPCLWAVVAGQTRATNKLLTLGADPNAISADGRSALAWAAGLGWSPIAELLVGNGAAVAQIQNTQMVPLAEAAASGDLLTVQLLLRSGGDPNSRDQDGWSAIHWAAEEGHLEVVRLLLDAGAYVNAISSYGTSPLHCAANGGHVAIISLLLSQQADPLKITCHGWTSLHHAAFMGHSHVVKCLLEDECVRYNASQQDNHGWSVLHLAVHSRDLATINILFDTSVIADPRGLCDESGLIAEEWLDRMPTSRSYKATSNLAFGKSRCCRAVTGLRQAVVQGNVPMLNLLVRMGHAVDGTDSGRRTALYYAAKKRMLSIVDLLLDMGADPSILPAGRRTWEEFISDDAVLRLLKRAGYRKRNIDPEVERQIRLAIGAQPRSSVVNRSVSFALDNSTSPMPDRSTFTVPDRSFISSSVLLVPSFPDHATSSMPTGSLAPTPQTNDNKRKAESGRAKSFWRRILR